MKVILLMDLNYHLINESKVEILDTELSRWSDPDITPFNLEKFNPQELRAK